MLLLPQPLLEKLLAYILTIQDYKEINMQRINILTFLVLFLAGCAAQTQPKVTEGPILPERYSMPTVDRQTPQPSTGAIFTTNSKNIYQDSRAHSIGDILLVKIVENSSADKNAETTTSHDSTLKGGVSSFFGYESLLRGKGGATHIPSLTSMNADLAKNFHGKGETKRDSKVTATISARVINVSMNGNLMIRGYQEVRVNNETQHIILSGIVRPEDVAKDNSILSSHIADARIEYNGIGVLSSKQQPGWLSNIIDVVWPF